MPADGVGDLQDADAAVPQVGVLEQPRQLGAHRLDRDLPVDVELDGAQQVGRAAGPVLERRRREVRGRQDQAAVVPDVHDDVGERDLLDAAPLVGDDDHVVHPDRVGERELQPGEHVGQGALRGQAGDDRDEPRGRQEARAERPGRREREQDRRDRAEHEDRDRDAAQHLDLRADAAGVPVVGDVDPVPLQRGVLEHEREAADQPRHGDDERDQQDVLDGPRPVGRVGAQAQRDPDRDHEQDRAHGLARATGEVGGDGRAAREAAHHHGEERSRSRKATTTAARSDSVGTTKPSTPSATVGSTAPGRRWGRTSLSVGSAGRRCAPSPVLGDGAPRRGVSPARGLAHSLNPHGRSGSRRDPRQRGPNLRPAGRPGLPVRSARTVLALPRVGRILSM